MTFFLGSFRLSYPCLSKVFMSMIEVIMLGPAAHCYLMSFRRHGVQ